MCTVGNLIRLTDFSRTGAFIERGFYVGAGGCDICSPLHVQKEVERAMKVILVYPTVMTVL